MKVSSKIISGFFILMLLAVSVLLYQLSVIHQMQQANRDLSELDMNSALTALRMQERGETFREDSRKFFGTGDPLYEHELEEDHAAFLDELAALRKTVRGNRERESVEKLTIAFDKYWATLMRFKSETQSFDLDFLPHDLIVAFDDFQSQTEVTYDAVKTSVKEQVAGAAAAGKRAEQLSWIAGVFSLLLGVVVAWMIFRSINDPLRRLTRGTRALAKGQFWHRLPAHGPDEFSELARDFNAMTERLGELDQMKKDFVSHVSHDLKAPLASMRQVMHLLLQEIAGPLNDQQKDLLRLSYNSAERLSAMVGNLLDLARMEAGSMEYQMAGHDLLPVIKTVTDEFAIQGREKGIRFSLECESPNVMVECDRDRIMQVIGNLYENALKFSPSNGDIITRVGEARNGSVLISVRDSGLGVPDGHKDKIFLKFHQVKKGKKMTGQGVGLGLAICKTIVQAHHGDIWVEDNPNGGSVFCFNLKTVSSEETIKCGQTA